MRLIGLSPRDPEARQAPANLGLPAQLRDVLQEPLIRRDRIVTPARELLAARETDQQVFVVELPRLIAGECRRVGVDRLREVTLALPRRRDARPSQRADRPAARPRERDLVAGARR